MEITGRVTDEARINTLNDGREVVNFCIAINERYKNKSGELKTLTAFINCSYWISTNVAAYLNKGVIVSLFGSISSKVYIDSNGEPQSVINYHVNNLKFLSKTNN